MPNTAPIEQVVNYWTRRIFLEAIASSGHAEDISRDCDWIAFTVGRTDERFRVRVVTSALPSDPEKADAVNHPSHYTWHPTGTESISISEWFSHNIGSAIDYLWRAGRKTPCPIEDYRKAVFFIEREIERMAKKGGD